MSKQQITAFLSALATEFSNYDTDPTIKSTEQILSTSKICEKQEIRCICGIDMQLQGIELIRCTKCGYYLHQSCLNLSEVQDLSQYVCPICVFQTDGSDPLSYLTCMTERFNDSINNFASLYKKGEEIVNELPYKLEKLESPNNLNYYTECFKIFESNIHELTEEYKSNIQKLNEIESISPPRPPSNF